MSNYVAVSTAKHIISDDTSLKSNPGKQNRKWSRNAGSGARLSKTDTEYLEN